RGRVCCSPSASPSLRAASSRSPAACARAGRHPKPSNGRPAPRRTRPRRAKRLPRDEPLVEDGAMAWRARGDYFESGNCEAICPCRRIDGVAGGRSTYGECLGVLTWLIAEGAADGVRLDGLKVALATRYHDDEPGSPWSFVLYLDLRADAEQREA